MSKIATIITSAFMNRITLTVKNDHTDGHALYLHGNKIAEWRSNELWITTAGWATITTKSRLNELPGVEVQTKNGQTYLNGNKWDGNWIKV